MAQGESSSSSSLQYKFQRIRACENEQENIQKKTFERWINSCLTQVDLHVDDLYKDLCNGNRLTSLLEIVSKEKVDGGQGRGRSAVFVSTMRIHHIQNVNKCLKFLQKKIPSGVELEGLTAEDIVNGNPKRILNLVWLIILKFRVEQIVLPLSEGGIGRSDRRGKEALLLWCQNKTRRYADVQIRDFNVSWRNGLAFSALIYSIDPSLIDIHSLSSKSDYFVSNLITAFEIAQKHFGVPRLLTAEDVAKESPEEKSIVTYLATFYHATKNRQPDQSNSGQTTARTVTDRPVVESRSSDPSTNLNNSSSRNNPNVNPTKVAAPLKVPGSDPEFSRFYSNVVSGTINFHRTRGSEISIEAGEKLNKATRQPSGRKKIQNRSNGYLFSHRPITPGEKVVIGFQVRDDEVDHSTSQTHLTDQGLQSPLELGFGVTSCDPGSISSRDLPDDANLLMDRSEYWTVLQNVELLFEMAREQRSLTSTGFELCFSLRKSGEIKMSKNGGSVQTAMHVDASVPLWIFFNVGGSSPVEIRLFGTLDPFANMEDKVKAQAQIFSSPSGTANLEGRSKGQDRDQNKDTSCLICCENPVDSVFLPCGHMCMCHGCGVKYLETKLKDMEPRECPICRKFCINVIRAYTPW